LEQEVLDPKSTNRDSGDKVVVTSKSEEVLREKIFEEEKTVSIYLMVFLAFVTLVIIALAATMYKNCDK